MTLSETINIIVIVVMTDCEILGLILTTKTRRLVIATPVVEPKEANFEFDYFTLAL